MPARIIIHSLGQARGALAAAQQSGSSVTLESAPGAGGYAGPAWFKLLVEEARREFPAAECEAWLDCGDEAGTVLAALRLGLKRIRFSGSDAALIRLGPVARELGAVLESRPAEAAFDLARTKAPEAMCRRHLAK